MIGMLWEIMEELYTNDPGLFPKFITSVEDVRTKIQLFRTMRQSSDSQALWEGVSESDISLVNQWSSSSTTGTASSYLYINFSQQDLLNNIFIRIPLSCEPKINMGYVGDLPSCQSFGPVCLEFIDYKSGSLHRALGEESISSDVIPERLFSI